MRTMNYTEVAKFVRVWQTAPNMATVANKTGLTQASASVKASKLRGLGVPLRKMPKGYNISKARLTRLKTLAVSLVKS